MNKPVFYDSDCLVCFLVINQCDILQELFSKIIVPLNVKEEIMNPSTPKIIKTNFSKLIKTGFVEIMEIDIESEEYVFYDRIRNNHLKNNKPIIGDGEAAVITLSHMHGGVVASNNLSDVYEYVKEYNLNLITTAFILAMAYNEEVKTKKELNDIWIKMQNKGRKRSLPKSDSFAEYYSKIYPKDSKFMGMFWWLNKLFFKNRNVGKKDELLSNAFVKTKYGISEVDDKLSKKNQFFDKGSLSYYPTIDTSISTGWGWKETSVKSSNSLFKHFKTIRTHRMLGIAW